jgi:hypothetical protein
MQKQPLGLSPHFAARTQQSPPLEVLQQQSRSPGACALRIATSEAKQVRREVQSGAASADAHAAMVNPNATSRCLLMAVSKRCLKP